MLKQFQFNSVVSMLITSLRIRKKREEQWWCLTFPACHAPLRDTWQHPRTHLTEVTGTGRTENPVKEATPRGTARRDRDAQKGNAELYICPATIIMKNQTLCLSAWWQLLMEMLQMRTSNNDYFLTTLSSVSQQEGARKWRFLKLGTD